MEIKTLKKPVNIKFIIIDGFEFEYSHLFCCLEEISETKEDDHYGDYSLRDYQLSYQSDMDKLVKMGLVKNYTGSRMANLYCIKDKKSIDNLLESLWNLSEDAFVDTSVSSDTIIDEFLEKLKYHFGDNNEIALYETFDEIAKELKKKYT